jgi:hypothetical protein
MIIPVFFCHRKKRLEKISESSLAPVAAFKIAYELINHNVDFFTPELDDAIDFGKNRIVLAHADVEAGVKFCPALTHDDRTGLGKLAAVKLYAAILRITVSSVSGRTLSFFMCHVPFSCLKKTVISLSAQLLPSTLAIKSGKVQKKNKKIHPLKFPPNERRQTVPFVCQGDANLLPLTEGEL